MDIWDEEEFYDLMQSYRHAPLADLALTVKCFEDVKAYIRQETKGKDILIERFRSGLLDSGAVVGKQDKQIAEMKDELAMTQRELDRARGAKAPKREGAQ